MDWKIRWPFLAVPLLGILLYALYAPMFLGQRPAPGEQPLFALDPIGPTADFCKQVMATKVFCQRAKVDCGYWKNQKTAAFYRAARACFKDPSRISSENAARYLDVFPGIRSALCCAATGED